MDDLVRRAAVSPRTLTRRFRAAVGMPPGEWLHRERLRLAQRLLERTDDPIEVVARRAGYDARGHDARAVRGTPATSPRGYRQKSSGPGRSQARTVGRTQQSFASGGEPGG